MWSQGRKKLVVGLDGYSGAGKTTLLNFIAEKDTAILPVSLDDFILTRKERRRRLIKGEEPTKVWQFFWYDFDKVKNLVRAFKRGDDGIYQTKVYNFRTDRHDVIKRFDLRKGILLLEGIFLFHPGLLDGLWDKRIYLNSSRATATVRRKLREKAKWGKQYVAEARSDSFARLFDEAHRNYFNQYHPTTRADLVL